MHLWIPFFASLLFVAALICINRLTGNPAYRVGPMAPLFVTNVGLAIVFSGLWLMGGTVRPDLWWQPVSIAIMFMAGLALTFYAVNQGDVSVATPVFGVKVIFVPLLLWGLHSTSLPPSLWISAAMATVGIAAIQFKMRKRPTQTDGPAAAEQATATADQQASGANVRRAALIAIGAASGAAAIYAMVDVSLQTWSPSWGAGRLLPLSFWCVGLMSLPMAWSVPWRRLANPPATRLLLGGSLMTVGQVVCITFTLSYFGDATRVNVVYGLRGLWSVALAFLVAKIWGGREAELSGLELAQRTVGAILLTGAVIVAII